MQAPSESEIEAFAMDLAGIAFIANRLVNTDFERIKTIRLYTHAPDSGVNPDPSPKTDWLINHFHQFTRDYLIMFEGGIGGCTIGEGKVIE